MSLGTPSRFRHFTTLTALALFASLVFCSPARADEPEIRFSFQGTAWRDVIEWLAEQSGSALHISDLPTGSFTYQDSNAFTPQTAIDRVNLFLLPQGFTIVRSGKLMSVVNLADPRSMQQLDALAKLVEPDELDSQPDHDVVKCIFPLGELKPEDAIAELTALQLMTTPAVFEKTKRILITDSVGKLKNVRAIIGAFQPDAMDNGTIVASFTLEHVDAEDVLVVARPHLGLATGEMIGIDVSISADPLGKNIFVTGVEDKVKVIERLIEAVDTPKESLSPTDSDNILKSYVIESGNVETVYGVLQTLMADRVVRLSMDDKTNAIVALANAQVQAEISETISKLKADDADFEVITLTWVDPYYAVTLIEQMLDLPGPMDDVDEDDFDFLPPKIDADPERRRLFVRGKRHQIDQIKKIVEGLDVSTNTEVNSEIRMVPLRGDLAKRVLRTAAKFWSEDNPIVLYEPLVPPSSSYQERVVGEDQSIGDSDSRTSDGELMLAATSTLAGDTDQVVWLAGNSKSPSATIRCQLTTRGLLFQSSDTTALDSFEQHLQMIAGPTDTASAPPTVFYLKYTKAHDGMRMLAELLDGGETASRSDSGGLVNGFVSYSSNFLGSILMARDGTMTMTNDSLTVVADSRLNRLIAQGSASDIQRIENYLKIIDRDSSITSVETYGASRVIELQHTRATEVAAAITSAFANYIGKPEDGTGGQSNDRRRDRGDDDRDNDSDSRSRRDRDDDQDEDRNEPRVAAAGKVRDLEPRLIVSVHEPSNALIVTAPPALFEKVEALARKIDSQAQQTVQMISPVNGEAMEALLKQMLLGDPSATSRPNQSRPSTPARSTTNRTGARR
ncbi:Bacterial type II/III secretion system short domain protein [Rubripirellula amarantea]|uniref:Bacterial type II/III secretion system short domain protein n=1 Tax=Rubripirellula amarantea TaxID=2527999 RepID=A0A5C5WKF4_9BACT|nr:secretin N-terminal domain-containing protein [Rubripirellula amarantea]TWT50585.1 Bacterial type II/III secretion system short domain protein [Rubripirellula amarantea]